MAVTGFWPVCGNLNATLKYADNPDKTTPREYLDEDLYAALRYVKNDSKTDKQVYVGGINCSKQNAYAEMIAIQRRFGMKGKVVGYHGIHTVAELSEYISDTRQQISSLEAERSKADNARRRAHTPEERQTAKERRKTITKEISPLREQLKRAEKIMEESPHLYELLQQEHNLEKVAIRKLERSR